MPLEPHGGKGLCVSLLEGEAREKLRDEATNLESLVLTPRQLCDIELILNGGFSPLNGFMNKEDYDGVVENMRMKDGTLWPIPITLDVFEKNIEQSKLATGVRVALRDPEGLLIAILTVGDIWQPEKSREAEKVFGSPDDECHPAIAYLFREAGTHYVGGTVEGYQLPVHYDYNELRRSPTQLRKFFADNFFEKVVAFQTRNPMHRSHRELTLLAAKESQANLLIHPVVGMTKPGDVDHFTRVRCYLEMMQHYPKDLASLSLLPLAMRMAGPREAVLHAIIRKNYGATHFIIGRDHAGPGDNKDKKPFYDPYAAQVLTETHAEELGIKILKYQMVVYIAEQDEYLQVDQVPEGVKPMNISGTELRRRLFKGIDIPEWFSYPSVVKILRSRYPARQDQGFTVFFTGLSGSGKSSIANALRDHLLQDGRRPVTLLDGDEIRHHLSSELGFSKEHRDLNIRRIGYVASLISRSRGVCIVSAIAPYREARRQARELVSKEGGFIEVHVSTPLDVCEARDRKGLYRKVRQGLIKGFTGIDDPYEAPENPEILIDTSNKSVLQCVHQIILHLESEGYLGVN
jgi:sulfate adenylyltransferase